MSNEINTIIPQVGEAYKLGRNLGEKDAIRFMVKFFMGSICEEHIKGMYEYFEQKFYQEKDNTGK